MQLTKRRFVEARSKVDPLLFLLAAGRRRPVSMGSRRGEIVIVPTARTMFGAAEMVLEASLEIRVTTLVGCSVDDVLEAEEAACELTLY